MILSHKAASFFRARAYAIYIYFLNTGYLKKKKSYEPEHTFGVFNMCLSPN